MKEYDPKDWEQPPRKLTPEEAFTYALINKRTKTKVSIELEDKETGDKIELPDILESIVTHLKDKMDDDETNQIQDQVWPLMAQSLISGLGRLIGNDYTAYMIGDDATKRSFIYLMMMSFMLYRIIQNRGLLINTIEEPVSDEEIESLSKMSEVSGVLSMTSMMGMNPKEILETLVQEGLVTEEDLDVIRRDSEDE